MVIQQEGACAYHQQQASGGIRGGSGSAGGGEGVGDDFFVVESGLTVEVGQGDGLFVIPKVYQITGLRAFCSSFSSTFSMV